MDPKNQGGFSPQNQGVSSMTSSQYSGISNPGVWFMYYSAYFCVYLRLDISFQIFNATILVKGKQP
jgi:hypothetical protein